MAMRVETQSGNNTNAASENSSIFDTRVTVGVAANREGLKESDEEYGRPAFLCPRGAFLWLTEYTYNLHTSPNKYSVCAVRKGIYADNPTLPDDIPIATSRLLRGGETAPETATFLGTNGIAQFLVELDHSEDRLTAGYLSRAVLIAVNYAQRTVPQDTTVVN